MTLPFLSPSLVGRVAVRLPRLSSLSSPVVVLLVAHLPSAHLQLQTLEPQALRNCHPALFEEYRNTRAMLRCPRLANREAQPGQLPFFFSCHLSVGSCHNLTFDVFSVLVHNASK